MATARKTGKVLDASEAAEIKKILKNGDKVDDATEIGKKALKYSDKYVKAAKKSVKNVSDLEAMAKHPEIFSSKAIEHTFLGNGSGGFHYNGLSISNGKILSVATPPNSNGVYEAFVEEMKYANARGPLPEWPEVSDAISLAFNEVSFKLALTDAL